MLSWLEIGLALSAPLAGLAVLFLNVIPKPVRVRARRDTRRL